MSGITPGISFPTRITVTSNFSVTASRVSQPAVVYVADTYTRSASIVGTLPPLSSVQIGGIVRLEQKGVYTSILSASGNDLVGYTAPYWLITGVMRADEYAFPITSSAAIVAASKTITVTGVTSTTGPFSNNDLDKWVAIRGAGAAGAVLSSVITSFVNTSTVMISTAATTSTTGAEAFTQIDSFMGIAGDTRPVIIVNTGASDQRVIGGILTTGAYPTVAFISSLTGSATITALNNLPFPAAKYSVGELYAGYIYLSTSISSGYTYSSGGVLGVARKSITLISPDNYVELEAGLDSDGTTRRWIVQHGTLDTIGAARDVAWGYMPYYTGYGQDNRFNPFTDFYYSGAFRRGSFRTWTMAEGGDPSEYMIGRMGGVYPYSITSSSFGEVDVTNGIGIIWSRVGYNIAGGPYLDTNRCSLITFRAFGLQTSSNGSGQMWFGNTYLDTISDRRHFFYLNQLSNVIIADANDKFNTPAPRLGVANALRADGVTQLDQTAAMFWVQSTSQTAPAVRIRGNIESTSYKLTLWETGATGGQVEAWIDGTGAGAIDTSWTSPATDLAEWKVPWWDGNPKMENRKARTVVFVDAANPDIPLARGTRGTHKKAKLRLYKSFDPPIPLSFICGVTTSNPAYAMGAAPIHHRSKYQTDKYGTVLWEEAEYVEWAETALEREGSSTNGYKFTRQTTTKGGFVDAGHVAPTPTPGDINDFVREKEDSGKIFQSTVWIHPATYSKQPRRKRSLLYKEELADSYLPRPERAEWYCAGITEKGMVPLHPDEPILDSWWVLGETDSGLLLVSI